MRPFIADRGDDYFLLGIVGSFLGCRPCGGSILCQLLQLFHPVFPALRDADFEFCIQGLGIRLGHDLRSDRRILRAHRNREVINLRGICPELRVGILLARRVQRSEEHSLRMKIVFHGLLQLCRAHAIRFLNRLFHRNVLVQH
jgi:hypothetical protein